MEISFLELLLIAVIAFLVLGPTELVLRAHQLGRFVGKLRTEMNNLRIMAEEQVIKKAELEEMREKIAIKDFHIADPTLKAPLTSDKDRPS